MEQERKIQRYDDELEESISAVDEIVKNTSFLSGITTQEELDHALQKLMTSLGRYAKADRAYLFNLTADSDHILHMTHEWCAEGVKPTYAEMQNIAFEDMPNWLPKLSNGEAVVSYDWESEKYDVPEEYALFDGQNIHALIVIPLVAGKSLKGYMGFDNPERSNYALYLRILKAVGSHVVSLRENLRMRAQLEEKQHSLEAGLQELNEEKQILDILSADYLTVCLCDFEQDTLFHLKHEPNSNLDAINQALGAENHSFSQRVRYYYDNFIVKESAPDFLEKVNVQYLRSYLAQHDRFAYPYRVYENPAGHLFFEVQIVALPQSTKFVMGYRYMDDLVAERERHKIQLENALAEVTLSNEIVGTLGKLYWLIYRMDLVTGIYEEVSADDEMHKLTGKRGNTAERFKEARESVVAAQYQESMKAFLDTSTLAERLRNTESIVTEYRAVSGSWHLARFIVKKRDSFGRVTNVLYVVRKIDREKEIEDRYKQRLEENSLVLSGLSRDYTIAFVVNLDTDEYEIVFYQKTNHAQIVDGVATFAEYVDRYAREVTVPASKEKLRHELSTKTMKQRFETESEYYFSFETIPNQAGLCYFQGHVVKEYNENGHYAFLGFRSVDDVVKQERYYKQALQKANDALQQQLDMITYALPGGVKISNDDETYSFKYVSEQFATMLGYDTPQELMEASGGNILGLAHPDDIDTGLSDALEQYSRSDHYVTTYRVRCKDGSYKYIEDRGRKVKDFDGVTEHWNLILDKHELMQKTIALESEKKANKSKSDFLSRMSHDMRTPLNGILGLLKIDQDHFDDLELVKENHKKMQISADHLLSLINDVLQMSKIEDGSVTLTREVIDLGKLSQDILTIIEERAIENGIHLEFQTRRTHTDNHYVYGSPLHLRQIFLNIYGNCIKYNRSGGKIITVADHTEEQNGMCTYQWTISDTGIGMSEKFLSHIFDPFVQERADARSIYQGTGLGMAIVKGLIEQMGGTISVTSQEGVGSAFVITIPFEIAHEAPKTAKRVCDDGIQGLHLMLVEDNELNAEIAETMLRDQGADVSVVYDGKQAVELFAQQPEKTFDCILMDIMMPVMDGFTATKMIRALERPNAKTIPIIAMTANAFEEDAKKCIQAGMNAHLAKPLDIEKVKQTICEQVTEYKG